MQALDPGSPGVRMARATRRKLHAGWRFKLSRAPGRQDQPRVPDHQVGRHHGGAEGTPNPDGGHRRHLPVELHGIPGGRAVPPGPQDAAADDPGSADGPGGGRAGRGDHDRRVWPHQGALPLGPQRRRRTRSAPAGSAWRKAGPAAAGARCSSRAWARRCVVEFLEGNPGPAAGHRRGLQRQQQGSARAARQQDAERRSRPTPARAAAGSTSCASRTRRARRRSICTPRRDYKRDVKHDEIVKIDNDRNVTITQRQRQPDGLVRQPQHHGLRRQERDDGGAVHHAVGGRQLDQDRHDRRDDQRHEGRRAIDRHDVAAGRCRALSLHGRDDLAELRWTALLADPDFEALLGRRRTRRRCRRPARTTLPAAAMRRCAEHLLPRSRAAGRRGARRHRGHGRPDRPALSRAAERDPACARSTRRSRRRGAGCTCWCASADKDLGVKVKVSTSASASWRGRCGSSAAGLGPEPDLQADL